ncbi:DUF4263 domain-containing protein [Kribbella sp. NBC_01510]|uniref:Shedu anti-phage system protein SduA domain-containing protein n=1 Tax=Kribbella sp. NBC_01510 TaxID=2903581 RepID=UPI00386C5388
MDLDLDWDSPLRTRRGAPRQLRGIRLFYDFVWRDVFSSGRAHFKNGLVLARTVQSRAPEGLEPALLLTRRSDVPQGFRQTSTHFLYILNIDEYRQAQGNPALSYLANHLAVDATEIHEFADLAQFGDPERVRSLLMRHIKLDDVVSWLNEDVDRPELLAELVNIGTKSSATMDDVVDSVLGLGGLGEEDIRKLVELTVGLTSTEHRADLLRGAMSDEEGRRAAGMVLGEQIAERIADAGHVVDAYEELLRADNTTETEMQKFLADNPLIFGLEYVTIRPQTRGPSGSMDFILERIDGYNDLVELKSPGDAIIKVSSRANETGSPSPHNYSLSSGLSQAVAQAMAYRDRLTRFADVAIELHGISNPRDPRLLIVLGRFDRLSPDVQFVLHELNRSLVRAQILPYDLLARRARAILGNVRSYLVAAKEHADLPT